MKTLLFLFAAIAFTWQVNAQNTKNTAMHVAIWDTYVLKKNGNVIHFDIIAPDNVKDPTVIYGFGRAYLKSIGEAGGKLEAAECQFCHVGSATSEMQESIREKGYFILEMEEIPAALPTNPTRRDMILHLRAHYQQFRFAIFQGVGDDQLREMLILAMKNNQE